MRKLGIMHRWVEVQQVFVKICDFVELRPKPAGILRTQVHMRKSKTPHKISEKWRRHKKLYENNSKTVSGM